MRLETERLVIRDWDPRDREPYAQFLADPDVRRFYFDVLDRVRSDALVDRFIAAYQRDGFGLLPVERKSDGAFLGVVGLLPIVDMSIRGNPPVEIGWLLGKQFWGQGYAPEAARAWLDHAFSLNLPEVVAWTTATNVPSQRVMQKLGMRTEPADDFIHPKAPAGHPLAPHVLYRISRPKPVTGLA
jgi:RimJ/RimL family protein N-acetyltransferase